MKCKKKIGVERFLKFVFKIERSNLKVNQLIYECIDISRGVKILSNYLQIINYITIVFGWEKDALFRWNRVLKNALLPRFRMITYNVKIKMK